MSQFVPYTQEEVFETLIRWGEARDSVRAILLTSTRAVPYASVDVFSDYDIILVVEDIHPFHAQRNWVEHFGDVLVTYWDPVHPEPGYDLETFGNVIQYADGLRIDFTLWPVELAQKIVQAPALPTELDAGYRLLLDKDGLAGRMKPPTYTAYRPIRPTNEEYQRMVEEFFSDAPVVAKCLLRGDLFPLKWCLDYDMKHVYLRPMLEWRVGIDHNWSVPVGALGKGLKKHLPTEIWSQLEHAYTGAGVEQNWDSLFRTMVLFRESAIAVGQALGYDYPYALDERVTYFVKRMQSQEATN